MQMPLEWAKNYRITVGIHTGKTLSEVAMIAPGALDWYLKKYSGNDFKLRAAVLILDCPFCLGKNGQPDRHGHSPPFPPPQSHCSQRRSCRRASSIRAA